MGHTARQFRALTKKNFISFFRQPGCAIFQLLCPGMLMFIMVYVRWKIKDSTPSHHDFEARKRPFFPGFEYLGGGAWDPTDYSTTSAR
jgi:hypothetical protein